MHVGLPRDTPILVDPVQVYLSVPWTHAVSHMAGHPKRKSAIQMVP